jgi:peptide/nickel transport system ATP-binding protein/oligopeptide transport system ATP-binding protein
MTLLTVRGLRTSFATDDGVVRAVDAIDFEISRGEILTFVGESGSGKSMAALSLMGLVPEPGRVEAGEILFGEDEPEDLAKVGEARLQKIRGDRIAMIFQDPMTSLNPYLTIGAQLAEVLTVHRRLDRAEADRRAARMLGEVGIPAPEKRLGDYPHQLSGGMRQRVMIAMALLCEPDLLIADEPTTALDVTVQAQILEIIDRLRTEKSLAVLLITHDLGVVARMADRVAVMYAGKIVEHGTASDVLSKPRHPYAIALRRSIPRLDDGERGARLHVLGGLPPSLLRIPAGCPFHPRCEYALDRCERDAPALTEQGAAHWAACHVEELS